MPRKIVYKFTTARNKYGQWHDDKVKELEKKLERSLVERAKNSPPAYDQAVALLNIRSEHQEAIKNYRNNKLFLKVSREAMIKIAINDLLTVAESRVLLFILAKADFHNEFIYHTKDISYQLNITPSTVSRSLTKLVELGFIDRSAEFIGYQVCTKVCWKGTKPAYKIQAKLESVFDYEADDRRKAWNDESDFIDEDLVALRQGKSRYKVRKKEEIKERLEYEEKILDRILGLSEG